MKRFLTLYSMICALALLVGETLVVIKTNKYWPLSLDDYMAVMALSVSIYFYHKIQNALGLVIVYAYVVGNLYAMLFTRLDPIHGSGERISLLAVALGVAVIGFAFSLKSQLSRDESSQSSPT
jgi:hypothetical protein